MLAADGTFVYQVTSSGRMNNDTVQSKQRTSSYRPQWLRLLSVIHEEPDSSTSDPKLSCFVIVGAVSV